MAGPLDSLPEVIDLTDASDERDEEPRGAENPHEGDFVYMAPRFR